MEEAFPELPEDVRRRAAARGLDLEASFRAFMLEVRVGDIPPRLLRNLGTAPVLPELELEPPAGLGWPRRAPAVATERELEVLRLLALGFSAPATAAFLGLSLQTVKTHLRRVTWRLGAGGPCTSVAAVAIAIRRGLLWPA